MANGCWSETLVEIETLDLLIWSGSQNLTDIFIKIGNSHLAIVFMKILLFRSGRLHIKEVRLHLSNFWHFLVATNNASTWVTFLHFHTLCCISKLPKTLKMKEKWIICGEKLIPSHKIFLKLLNLHSWMGHSVWKPSLQTNYYVWLINPDF